MNGLSMRQRQCLKFIESFTASNDMPPTLREIGEFMGIRSTNGVNDHLNALERKRMIDRRDMKARGLRVTTIGRQELGLAPPPKALPPSEELKLLLEVSEAWQGAPTNGAFAAWLARRVEVARALGAA